jgi:ribosome recycling factor
VRNAHEKTLNSKLQQQVDELEKLRTKRIQQMSLQLEGAGGIAQIIEDKKHKEQQRIEKLFDDYIQWIEDTMTTEKDPYIHVIAVFTGTGVDHGWINWHL